MLGGLLKPGWRSDSPEKRCSSILKMNVEDDANQSIFEALALNDLDHRVRQACIKQLRSPASLFTIFQNHDDSATKQTAKVAFCQLIGRKSELSESEFETLVSKHSDASTLIAQHCPHPELRLRLFAKLEQIDQAKALGDIDYAETRLHIAQHLDQVDALEAARNQLKGKDKNSEKIIRAKLEELRTQKKLEDEINQLALTLCEQMEFIAKHPEWRSEFKGKYDQYILRWSALALSPKPASIERFNSSQSEAKLKVDKQIQQETAVQNQQQITDKLERYCSTLAPLSLEELRDEHLSINTVLGEALAVWLENSVVVSPTPVLAKNFLNTQQALSSLSDLIETTSSVDINIQDLGRKLNAVNWQVGELDLLARTEASDLLSNLEEQNSAQKKQQKNSLDALHKRINRLLGTSNKGDIVKARGELSATTKAVSHYSGKERKTLDERLEMAGDIVSKMSDWQNFAIEPKLLDLCQSMEKLIESNSHPDKLAQEIAKLQNKWKNLGHTDASNDHWLRFKTAADLAYAPCATFFEERKINQKNNLTMREPLVTKMAEILEQTDWNNTPDYKQVESQLRDIGNDWRKIKDVERHAGQKQWNRLVTLRDSIYKNLDPVYDANIEQKRQIIGQVKALTEHDVSDSSLDKLKLFQSRWKQVGITRRKQDQEAWEAFRTEGDRLFERVKSLRNQKRATEDQQVDAYRAIIKEIHSLANSATNLADADSEFEKLNERYKALPRLPKDFPEKTIERLEKDFSRAETAYSLAHERIIQASKNDVINKIAEKSRLCSEYEAAVSHGDEDRVIEIKQTLDSLVITDKSIAKRFEARIEAATQTDKSAANRARSLLCIDLEILLDLPSPEHEKAQRMQIQLERMKNVGIGKTAVELKQSLNKLKLDWFCLPGAESELQIALEARFNDSLAKQSQ